MPGRKSAVSTTSNGPEEISESAPSKPNKEREGLSVDDLSLPKSMIARLAKGVLPANTQIHKDALLALHKSATVFVSYIASNSNDNAQASGKKTISPQDVTAALKDAEFEGFLPRLEAELKKYNDTQCDKRNTYRRKVKEEKAAAATKDESGQELLPKDGASAGSPEGVANGHELIQDESGERPVKKFKRDDGTAVPPEAEGVEDDEEEADDVADENEDEDLDDVVDDAEDDEDDDGDQDEQMEDALEEILDRSELQDEALDEADSD